MGRRKNDVMVKPNPNLANSYMIRFTNEEAMKYFAETSVTKGFIKPGVVYYRLNKWVPINAVMFNHVIFGLWINNYNSDIEAPLEHIEHGLPVE